MEDLCHHLVSLSSRLEENPECDEAGKSLIEFCLTNLDQNGEDQNKILKALADMCRNESGRRRIDAEVVRKIAEKNWPVDNDLSLIEICRFGGNLCFDNPSGRQYILHSGMLDKLGSSVENATDTFPCSKLWRVLPSFLHNYCHENKTSLESISTLSCVLAKYFTNVPATLENVDLVENYVNFLSGLLQHNNWVTFFSQEEVVKSLVSLFQIFDYATTSLALIELFQDMFENEEMASVFADHGIVPALVSRADGYCIIVDEDSGSESRQSSEEVSCQSLDLIALVSSHGSVLVKILSLSPSSQIFTEISGWMLSPKSDHHLATGALLVGNLATSDTACVQLMETDLPGAMVARVNTASPSKVLHAVVGCLRNLAVCQLTRDKLCSMGLVSAASSLLTELAEGKDHTVTPKLLSILRLVTQVSSEVSLFDICSYVQI